LGPSVECVWHQRITPYSKYAYCGWHIATSALTVSRNPACRAAWWYVVDGCLGSNEACCKLPNLNPMAHRDDNHECASLIPRQDAPRTPQKRGHGRTSPTTIVFLLALWVLCAGSSDELVQPPQLRIVESIYCRIFFANDTSGKNPREALQEPLGPTTGCILEGVATVF
jgi:hypothetical protein